MEKILKVQFEDVWYEMTAKEIKEKGWNVVVCKSNGYSHSYLAIETFNENKHQGVIFCTTKQVAGFIQGTSSVSFS